MSDESQIPEEQLAEEAAEFETTVESTAEETAAQPTVDDKLAEALQEIANIQDQMLRTQAEMQNIRRRAEADVEKAHKFGSEKFANEMLSVVDNLERAIAACVAEDEATQTLRQGVELTLTGLLSSLAKFNVEAVNPEGEPFNPELHQAMTMVDAPDAAPNTVLNVMQKGYTLHGRLLRPAMVVVSKAAPSINANV